MAHTVRGKHMDLVPGNYVMSRSYMIWWLRTRISQRLEPELKSLTIWFREKNLFSINLSLFILNLKNPEKKTCLWVHGGSNVGRWWRAEVALSPLLHAFKPQLWFSLFVCVGHYAVMDLGIIWVHDNDSTADLIEFGEWLTEAMCLEQGKLSKSWVSVSCYQCRVAVKLK